MNPKIVQKSRNNILSKSLRDASAYFRGVSEYFREVSACLHLETSFQISQTSFEKFWAIVATGGLE